MKRKPFRLYGSYVAVLLELLALLRGCTIQIEKEVSPCARTGDSISAGEQDAPGEQAF